MSTVMWSAASMAHSRASSPSCLHAAKKTSRIWLVIGTVTRMHVRGSVRHTSKCAFLPASGCGGTSTGA
eukprot:11353079-Alexandrium_andersonii.AAC.1